MKKIFMVMVIGVFFMVFSTSLYAAGTAADAEAMVKKAATFLKAQGKDKAFKEFTEGTQFKKEDLYIFVIDVNGMTLAHGGNPSCRKDMSGLKDADGKFFSGGPMQPRQKGADGPTTNGRTRRQRRSTINPPISRKWITWS